MDRQPCPGCGQELKDEEWLCAQCETELMGKPLSAEDSSKNKKEQT